MTIKELCWELNLSESTIKASFNRTRENLAKKGIKLEKHGRGDSADYVITKIDKEN